MTIPNEGEPNVSKPLDEKSGQFFPNLPLWVILRLDCVLAQGAFLGPLLLYKPTCWPLRLSRFVPSARSSPLRVSRSAAPRL